MYSIIEKHYRHNYKQFVKLATYKLNTREDGEDAVQEAYARAMKYSNAFEMGMHFNHWFMRILRNVIKDAISEKYGRMHLEELDEEQVEGKEESNYSKRLLAIVEKEINETANAEHREILELYFTYGFSHSEINELTPSKYHTIRTVIDRFKRSLRTRE